MRLILRVKQRTFGGVAICAILAATERAPAQETRSPSNSTERRISIEAPRETKRRGPRQTAGIHWQGVPLDEAITRLRTLFPETIFVDRRVDPEVRVSLEVEASSAEQALGMLATAQGLGVSRLGKVVYLGPSASAERLKTAATLRAKDVSRLPSNARTSFASRRSLDWPRLAEPRKLVESVAQQAGWKLGNPEQIPFDLWPAGRLPELNVTDQLTLLLIGFDLTFEVKPDEHTINIVPLAEIATLPASNTARTQPAPKANASRPARGKQMFSLRVEEKPVGVVLRQLATKLNWSLQIDEDAIRAAGLSLEKRVSFNVDQVDQEKLLEALLTPAGLEYTIDGNQVRVMPSRYGTK